MVHTFSTLDLGISCEPWWACTSHGLERSRLFNNANGIGCTWSFLLTGINAHTTNTHQPNTTVMIHHTHFGLRLTAGHVRIATVASGARTSVIMCLCSTLGSHATHISVTRVLALLVHASMTRGALVTGAATQHNTLKLGVTILTKRAHTLGFVFCHCAGCRGCTRIVCCTARVNTFIVHTSCCTWAVHIISTSNCKNEQNKM